MRLLVAIENKIYPDGRSVVPGGICMDDDTDAVPVLSGVGLGEVVGFAQNLQREDDSVFMDVEFNKHLEVFNKQTPETMMAAAFLKPVIMSDDDSLILKGWVRSVSVGVKP